MLDFYSDLTEVLDLGSFSNVWYWISLAAIWSMASYWVLGVPYDLIRRAARDERRGNDLEASRDLEEIVRINATRMLSVAATSGLWILGGMMFVLTSLATLGFVYDVELAQAVFLILFPMSFVGLMSLNTAAAIRERALEGAALRRRLMMQRLQTQGIGAISVFITAMWGMYQNFPLREF